MLAASMFMLLIDPGAILGGEKKGLFLVFPRCNGVAPFLQLGVYVSVVRGKGLGMNWRWEILHGRSFMMFRLRGSGGPFVYRGIIAMYLDDEVEGEEIEHEE